MSDRDDDAIAPVEQGCGFETPCDARRGQVDERPDGLFLHFCEECGAWGAFGYGVSLDERRAHQRWKARRDQRTKPLVVSNEAGVSNAVKN